MTPVKLLYLMILLLVLGMCGLVLIGGYSLTHPETSEELTIRFQNGNAEFSNVDISITHNCKLSQAEQSQTNWGAVNQIVKGPISTPFNLDIVTTVGNKPLRARYRIIAKNNVIFSNFQYCYIGDSLR